MTDTPEIAPEIINPAHVAKQEYVAQARKEQATGACHQIARRRAYLKAEAEALAVNTKMTVLAAHDAGLTYEQIAEAIDLSRPRISQMLQEARGVAGE